MRNTRILIDSMCWTGQITDIAIFVQLNVKREYVLELSELVYYIVQNIDDN